MNLPLSPGAKALLYEAPVDMRYGMFRLQSLILSAHGSTKESAYHFFVKRPMSLLKVMWFDGTGLCMPSNGRKKAASPGRIPPWQTTRRE